MPTTVDIRGQLHPFGNQKFDYLAHNIDDANDTKYFGFVSHIGSWIIMRYVESTGIMRYSVGKTDYSTNWTNRASLSYDTINEVIP